MALTFKTRSNLIQLPVTRQLNQYGKLAEAANMNGRRTELQQWTPITVLLMGLHA